MAGQAGELAQDVSVRLCSQPGQIDQPHAANSRAVVCMLQERLEHTRARHGGARHVPSRARCVRYVSPHGAWNRSFAEPRAPITTLCVSYRIVFSRVETRGHRGNGVKFSRHAPGGHERAPDPRHGRRGVEQQHARRRSLAGACPTVQAGSVLPRVSSPNGTSTRPTRKATAVQATGRPMVW